ncbi:MAG: hypothetical protein EOO01_12005 [Chitinophagaceae bacterium]|nr:MAG: hypothetical protein EOO01_12005 [Chitinophagaceae bacterium]
MIEDVKQETIWLAESEEVSYAEVFDITFTWRWMHESQSVLSHPGGIEKLWKFLEEDNFPGLRLYFTSNHDENSWNGTEYEKYGVYARALAVFSCLYKSSVPLIYSGQEVANKKRLSFFEKDLVDWSGGEDLGRFYSTLLSLRKKPGIVFNEKEFRLIHHPELVVFLHSGEAGTIWVLLHLGRNEVSIQPFEIAGVEGLEVFTEETLDKNSPPITMQPGDYHVYESFRSA